MSGSRIQIGYVLRAHGVRGWLRARADGDALLSLSQIFIDGRPFKIRQAQRAGTDVLMALEGVADRDQAEALRGRPLEAERAQMPAPADDEVYVSDLIGCQVVGPDGAELGTVAETFHSGAHEILVVRGGAREFMLPFVDGMITGIDLPARRIACDPPVGLVDPDEADQADEG